MTGSAHGEMAVTGSAHGEMAVTGSAHGEMAVTGSDGADPAADALEPIGDGSVPGRFTAVVCGPASAEAWALTTASLLNGANAARLSGIIEIDRNRSADGAASAEAGWERATGGHLLFLPAGGLVVPDGLERLGLEIDADPEADVIYVDDAAYPAERPADLTEPAHRPGFSPDRLRAQMYLGPMVAVRRALAIEVDPDGGRLRSPLAPALAVVATSRARAVVHVPEILFHRRVDTDTVDSGLGDDAAELSAVLAAQGFPAVAAATPTPSLDAGGEALGGPIFRIEPRLDREPPVSIVIPTNGGRRRIGGIDTVLVHHAVSSVLDLTTYRNYELVIVISPGGPSDLVGTLRSMVRDHRNRSEVAGGEVGPSIRFCPDQRPFNFSNASNRGAVHGDGEILVFLNDDTCVISPDWLHRLVMYASRPDIGAVGTRLSYEGGTVQHAGIWTRGGHPTHRYDGFPGGHDGYRSALRVPQNCLAVTGACLAVETTKFVEVGGFSPRFPSSYNDVDLCLKLADRGYRTLVDPDTRLFHYGSSSRDPGIEDWELALLHDRWRSVLNDDPFDNPNHVAPLSDEFPPPDAVISDQRRRSGMTGHRARRWPSQPLTAGFPTVAPDGRPAPGTIGPDPDRPEPVIDLDPTVTVDVSTTAEASPGPVLVELKAEVAAEGTASSRTPSMERPD